MVFSYLNDALMIVGPTVGYLSQWVEINRKRDATGFSTKVSLILIASSILRIAYYYHARFAIPLLLQSIVMLVTQMILLRTCVSVTPKDKFSEKFWEWKSFSPYFSAVLLFMSFSLSFSFVTLGFPLATEVMGYSSLLVEACMALPQALKNAREKSTEGLSLFLVLTWAFGDAYKLHYFSSNGQSHHFILCAALQIGVDLLVLYQIAVYGGARKKPVPVAERVFLKKVESEVHH